MGNVLDGIEGLGFSGDVSDKIGAADFPQTSPRLPDRGRIFEPSDLKVKLFEGKELPEVFLFSENFG